MAKNEEKQKAVEGINFSEQRYNLIRSLITESGTVNKEVLNSYRGSSNYSLIFGQDKTLTPGQEAAQVERYIINDNMAELFMTEINLYFSSDSKDGLFNQILNKVYTTDSEKEDKELLVSEIKKLMAYLMHTNNGNNIENYINDLKTVFENREDKEFNKQISLIENFINNTENKNLILKAFENSQDLFKDRFINNQINEQLITIKSNETLKKKILKFYEGYLENSDNLVKEIDEIIKNLSEKELTNEIKSEIEKLERDKLSILNIKENVDIDKLKSKYNFDTIIIYKDFLFTNEIKSGVSSIVTKFLANFSGLKDKAGLIDSLTMFFLYKDLVPEMFESKQLWEDSLEYREAQDKIKEEQSKTPNLSDEIKERILYEQEIKFIARIIQNAQEFRTYEEFHIHLVLSNEQNKNKKERDKALKERLAKLTPTEREYLKKISLPTENTLNNLNLYFKGNGGYTIQVNDRLANIYMANASKQINYLRFQANFSDSIDEVLKELNIDIENSKRLKEKLLENLDKNKNKYDHIEGKDFLIGIQDLSIQASHYLKKECSHLIKTDNPDIEIYKSENYIVKVVEDINAKLAKISNTKVEQINQLNFIKNTLLKAKDGGNIDNKTQAEFFVVWKDYLKKEYKYQYKINAPEFDRLIYKNATVSTSLDNFLIDKNKEMFNIKNSLFEGINLKDYIKVEDQEKFKKTLTANFHKKDDLSMRNHSIISFLSSFKLDNKSEINSYKMAKNLYLLIKDNNLELLLSEYNQKPEHLPKEVETILQLARISSSGKEYYKELKNILNSNEKYIELVIEKRGSIGKTAIKELNVFKGIECHYENIKQDIIENNKNLDKKELDKLLENSQAQYNIAKNQFEKIYETHMENVFKILKEVSQKKYDQNDDLKEEIDKLVKGNINNLSKQFINLSQYKDKSEVIQKINSEIREMNTTLEKFKSKNLSTINIEFQYLEEYKPEQKHQKGLSNEKQSEIDI